MYEVLEKIGSDSKVGIYLRDGNFSSNYGLLNLHPIRGTHWVCYIKDCLLIHMVIHHLKKFVITLKKEWKMLFNLNIGF